MAEEDLKLSIDVDALMTARLVRNAKTSQTQSF